MLNNVILEVVINELSFKEDSSFKAIATANFCNRDGAVRGQIRIGFPDKLLPMIHLLRNCLPRVVVVSGFLHSTNFVVAENSSFPEQPINPNASAPEPSPSSDQQILPSVNQTDDAFYRSQIIDYLESIGGIMCGDINELVGDIASAPPGERLSLEEQKLLLQTIIRMIRENMIIDWGDEIELLDEDSMDDFESLIPDTTYMHKPVEPEHQTAAIDILLDGAGCASIERIEIIADAFESMLIWYFRVRPKATAFAKPRSAIAKFLYRHMKVDTISDSELKTAQKVVSARNNYRVLDRRGGSKGIVWAPVQIETPPLSVASWNEVREESLRLGMSIDEGCRFFQYLDNRHWRYRGNPVLDWKQQLKRWSQDHPMKSAAIRLGIPNPTLDEVAAEGARICLPRAECEAFLAYHAARGWVIRGSVVRDWKQALIYWNRNHRANRHAMSSSNDSNTESPKETLSL